MEGTYGKTESQDNEIEAAYGQTGAEFADNAATAEAEIIFTAPDEAEKPDEVETAAAGTAVAENTVSKTEAIEAKKEKENTRKTFMRGAMILAICGVLGKFLGAVYRIPLTNILGAEGIGLYQMVFPVYSLLLTISSTGLPTAISRLIAERRAVGNFNGAHDVHRVTFSSLLITGLITGVAVYFLSDLIARMQGNILAGLAYKGIAPAIVFVAIISSYRGFFQGRRNMIPSAVSQLTEQLVKMAAGLTLAYLMLPLGIEYAVFGAVLGVTISELVTVVSLFFIKRKYKDERTEGYVPEKRMSVMKNIYKIAIPITIGGLILPLTQAIDSVMIINILKSDLGEKTATALYGLSTGPISSLINMPAVISLSIGAATLPSISHLRLKGENEELNGHIGEVVKMTMIFTLPCFIGLLFLARPIIVLLYGRSLSLAEIDIAGSMLAMSSIGVLYLSILQVFTSVIQGMGKTMVPVFNLFIGALVKTAVSVILLLTVGIIGAIIGTTVCYMVSAILNTAYMTRKMSIRINILRNFLLPLAASLIMGICAYLLYWSLSRHIGVNYALITGVLLGVLVYFVSLAAFGIFDPAGFIRKFFKGKNAKNNLVNKLS